MKSALYHQEGKTPQTFVILKENEDGTLDLGNDAGELVIGSCVVVDEAKPGFATITENAPAGDAPLAGKKVDELREIAAGLGIEVAGLKKDQLIAAIEAKQKPSDA